MKKLLLLILLLLPGSAMAAESPTVPGLKIAPLKYQQAIDLGSVTTGFVDVSNPTNKTVKVISSVKAFKQVDEEGNLEFYDDERITKGIVPDLKDFDIPAKGALRLGFKLDPNVLGERGVTAALFVETVPTGSGGATQVRESARVGALLILDVGGKGVKKANLNLSASPLQLGSGVKAYAEFSAAEGDKAVAFNPKYAAKVGWLDRLKTKEGSLVTPGVTREVVIEKKGNYIGLVPVKVQNQSGGGEKTVLVLAVTGFWRWIILLILTALALTIYEIYVKEIFRKK